MNWQTRAFLLITFVIAGIAGCAQRNNEEDRLTTSLQPVDVRALDTDSDGRVLLTGRIIENVRDCEVDVACLLVIDIDGFKANVVYHFGEWPPCDNIEAIRSGEAVEDGELVEVFAGIIEGNELTTCTSPEFYIHSIKEQ